MNDFKEFFATNDDIMCSTITIFYTCLVVYFPVYAYFKIKFHQDNFDDPDPFLETLLEGVNPHNYHASMYTVYFLIRRFLTGFGLVVFVANPFFQCASLMVFTTVNLIYLINIQPLEDSKQNKIEILNEVTVMLSAHVFNIFLRGEGTDGFINNMGWVYIGISVFNILINLAIVLIDSIYETGSEYLEKRQQEKKLKFIQERRENRQKIVDEAPG